MAGEEHKIYSGPQVKGRSLRLYFVYIFKVCRVPSHPEGTVSEEYSQTEVARMGASPVSHTATTIQRAQGRTTLRTLKKIGHT